MSKIEWTERTWNPVVGCSIVSPGCTNCYAMRMAQRIERMGSAPHYRGLTKVVNGKSVWTGKLAQAPEHILLEPLRVKRPTTWFVNSMSDLFHEDAPDAWIDQAFAVMALCRHHTFQVLTKRSDRMRTYMADPELEARWMNAVADLFEIAPWTMDSCYPIMGQREEWLPLPNVWLGTSVERPQENHRIDDLVKTPAAVRFISAEPLLAALDLSRWLNDGVCNKCGYVGPVTRQRWGLEHPGCTYSAVSAIGIHWVIVGGESGPGARPFDLVWARSIIGQCSASGVACFVKQVGSHPTDGDRPGLKGKRLITKSKKGGDMAEWPPELRVRQMPVVSDKAEAA